MSDDEQQWDGGELGSDREEHDAGQRQAEQGADGGAAGEPGEGRGAAAVDGVPLMRGWSQQRRLRCVLALNLAMIAGLVLAGLTAHSLGVLAAAGDFAADSVALMLGLVAVALRDRPSRPAGYRSRTTTIVALINGTALLAVTVLVIVEAVGRLRHGTPAVQGRPVLIVSVISTLVMLAGAAILGLGAGQEDLHMRSVLLDTLADGAAAAAVAVAGAIIAATHRFYWLDPALAAVIAVGVAAVKLLADGIREVRSGA